MTFAIVTFTPMIFNRYYFHGDNEGKLVFMASMIPWHILNIYWMHLIVTKAGYLYIESEVLRGGNEEILDGLEEGVVIIGEANKNILYYNAAATRD